MKTTVKGLVKTDKSGWTTECGGVVIERHRKVHATRASARGSRHDYFRGPRRVWSETWYVVRLASAHPLNSTMADTLVEAAAVAAQLLATVAK